MRAVILQDHDFVALIDKLRLVAAEHEKRFGMQDDRQKHVADECFRAVHYHVVSWAQQHGAKVT
jgi:hypothetical protein